MSYLSISIMALQATVFAASSLGKARATGDFVLVVYTITRGRAAKQLAVAVILLELLVVVLCVLPILGSDRAAAPAFLLAATLLVAFVLVMHRRPRSPCRCFGRHSAVFSRRHVIRNLLLAILAVVGLVAYEPVGVLKSGGVVGAILFGVGIGSLVILMDKLMEIFGPAVADGFRH